MKTAYRGTEKNLDEMNAETMALVNEIKRRETNRLEFKADLSDDNIKFVKTAVAFSNGIGGKILFGVQDNGTHCRHT